MTTSILPRALSRKQFVVILGFFLVILGSIFSWMLWSLTPQLRKFQNQEIFYQCEEVVSGEELLMRPLKAKGETHDAFLVRVRGIEAPPNREGSEVAAFAMKTGLPESEILEMGKISRNTLAAWLYMQSNIMMKFDREQPEYDAQGRLIAHVELSLVDVGKMQLIEGQAIFREEPNDYATLYATYTEKAQNQNFGIWRFPRVKNDGTTGIQPPSER